MADCSTSKEPPKPISQRAARKAAAACLARQRHKSFVNTLQDAIEARKMRVGVLKKRKEDYFAAVAAHMIRGIRAQLSPAREAELQRWLQRSERMSVAWHLPPEEKWMAAASEGKAAPSSSKAAEAPVRASGKKAPPKDTMRLDEALAQQEFVTEAMHAASDAALAEGEEAFSDDEVFDASMVEVGDDDDIDEADEYYDEYVSYDDTYGDGLVALLQHLSADRRSTVQAWLQLKDDTEGRAYHESTWTNLSALEEDFLLINSEHRPSDALSMPMPMRPTART
uniref:Uncharacterized protein n=1 Tax=Emiliania huxleyi TaxID=2903 RepID=A0A6U9DN95_EMIHU|mmetsp:Transcript_8501/g.27459  ORF Transcript_8501/g.27459 Transcript_8501/m.27459 type:complete len:282 (-) Transcript_8501:287-1132(-)